MPCPDCLVCHCVLPEFRWRPNYDPPKEPEWQFTQEPVDSKDVQELLDLLNLPVTEDAGVPETQLTLF